MLRDGNVFTYRRDLVCRVGVAKEIEILCFAQGGRPSCGSEPPVNVAETPDSQHHNETSTNSGRSESQEVTNDSANIPAWEDSASSEELQKRNLLSSRRPSSFGTRQEPYYCKKDPAQPCDDIKVAGATGNCPKSYTKLEDQVYGKPPGFWCRRACSGFLKQECFNAQCQYYLAECRKSPGNPGSCGYALARCRDPVRTNKDTCTNSIFTYQIGQRKKNGEEGFERPPPCSSCVSYSGNLCTLNRNAFSQYQQSLESKRWDTRTLAYNGKKGGSAPEAYATTEEEANNIAAFYGDGS